MELVQPVAITVTAGRLPTANKALKRLVKPKPIFELHGIGSLDRTRLESYIAREFDDVYDAHITGYLPELFSMQCHGRYSAVGGLRPATDGQLFLEQYLDCPVEDAIGNRFDTPVSRHEIIEVGNLVATHRGATQLFFMMLAAIGLQAGFRWAVFSATDKVARIIHKLNFVVLPLADADPEKLGGGAIAWGRYYETRPVVLAGDIRATVSRLRQSLLADAAMTLFGPTISKLATRLRRTVYQ